jgi:hypothetical protein
LRKDNSGLRHRKWEMPVWVWIVVGLGSFLVLSLLVGLALARILGTIGRRISELHETGDWALPPTRASKDVSEQQTEEDEAKSSQVHG